MQSYRYRSDSTSAAFNFPRFHLQIHWYVKWTVNSFIIYLSLL